MFRVIFVFCFASGAIVIALAVESIDRLAPHAAAVHLCEVTRLDESNPYGVEPNAYIVQHYYDATNGKICATEVRKNQASSVIHGYFVYNPTTGNLISEQRNDWMPSGGRAVGADTEAWLRRIEKHYDEATGNVKQVKQMRYCNSDERKRFGGSHFVEITPDDQSTEAKQLDEK